MNSDFKTFIIAEAGVNHNGSIDMGKRLIDVAVEAGADAVKFQTFRAEHVVSLGAPKAEYQTHTTDKNESQVEMIRKLELTESDHEVLIDHAEAQGITFLSTPFDFHSLHLLARHFGIRTIKIPSGEITNAPFLLEIARVASRVILSTGMSTLGEVEAALGILAFGFTQQRGIVLDYDVIAGSFASAEGQQALRDRVILLHCTTEYPAPYAEVNLRAMDTLAEAFGLTVGYSDHTQGIHISVAAVALGARVIEKHFTLDSKLPGPDHKASLEPDELRRLVAAIRDVEQARGDGVKRPTAAEWKNRAVARKSLVATRAIAKGEVFSVDNLACKRPGNGISPMQWYAILGRTAPRAFSEDELIELDCSKGE
jgi:N-acetylneuraminate synthase